MSDLLLAPALTGRDYNNPSTGIHSLHTEILWSIFALNADIRGNCPLKTARLTSQVCRSWRNLMLASPGIWGKILKLAELQIDKDNSPWRDVVMERTGCASLFFEGNLSPSRIEWFLSFISGYWGRICHLDTPSAGAELDVLSTNMEFMDEPSRCVVFHLRRVPFNLQAPWIPNLRSITLSNPLSTTRILECLDHMPHLEHANLSLWLPDILNETFTDTILGEPKQISLPHLTSLHISHYYSFVTAIFRCITAHPLCSYKIATVDHTISTLPEREIFSDYFQRHIDSSTDPRVQIMVTNDSVAVLVKNSENHFYRHTHSVNLSVVQESDLSTYMALFYSGNSTSRITKLVFVVDITVEDSHLNHTLDSIKDFLLAFQSVTTLQLSAESLPLFTKISSDNETLLPSLKELALGYFETLTLPFQTQIIEFLDRRRSYGRPIKTLHLGLTEKIEKLNVPGGFLEGFDDMEVHTYTKAE